MENYPNIKLFKLGHMTSSEPQEDLLELDPYYQTWTSADKNNVELFSAVCLLTARFMADTLGQNKVSYIKNISKFSKHNFVSVICNILTCDYHNHV